MCPAYLMRCNVRIWIFNSRDIPITTGRSACSPLTVKDVPHCAPNKLFIGHTRKQVERGLQPNHRLQSRLVSQLGVDYLYKIEQLSQELFKRNCSGISPFQEEEAELSSDMGCFSHLTSLTIYFSGMIFILRVLFWLSLEMMLDVNALRLLTKLNSYCLACSTLSGIFTHVPENVWNYLLRLATST